MNTYLKIIGYLICSTILFGCSQEPIKPIEITDAYIRGMPTTATTTAAYLKITNNTQEDWVLIGGSSSISDCLEIHGHRQHNGMMQMYSMDKIVIPANQSISFAPGELHLMLTNVQWPPKKNTLISVTLWFKNHPSMALILPIRHPLDE